MATVSRDLVRFALLGMLIFADLAATPPARTFVVATYGHAQRLVPVFHRRMNIFCSGVGSPTVILDAGLGDASIVWRYVQGPVARHTRVCSYDRAGMGFSEPTTSRRDASAVASDLHALLHRAGIAPPYVLVGHSIAGLYTRLYADLYSRDVVGLVLIDPSTEYDDAADRKLSAAAFLTARAQQRAIFRKCANDASTCSLSNIRTLRKQLKAVGCPKVDPIDCAANDVFFSQELVHPWYWNDQLLELSSFSRSCTEVHTEQRPYGTLPLIVLSSGQPDIDPGPVSTARQHAIWVAEESTHDRIAALSSRGVNFVIEGSGHEIQQAQPSAVISAIVEVVDQARAHTPLKSVAPFVERSLK